MSVEPGTVRDLVVPVGGDQPRDARPAGITDLSTDADAIAYADVGPAAAAAANADAATGSTAPHSTAPHSTAPHSTAPHSTASGSINATAANASAGPDAVEPFIDAGVPDDFPTVEELQLYRRVSAPLCLRVFSVALVELCERFSYYGTVNLLTNFIQHGMPAGSATGAPPDPRSPEAQPGALGMGQRASTGITTFNQFWQYLMPLFGAYVADQYLGRFNTICVALGIDIAGHLVLVSAAVPGVIEKRSHSLAALLVGLVVIGFGTGGFKPNVSPLIAEQMDVPYMRVADTKSGETVIIDPAATASKIYMWFYFFINIGSLLGSITMSYAERYVGFWLSFVLPTVMLCLCPPVMIWGRKRYRRHPAAGSVLVPAVRTWLYAQKGRWSVSPVATWRNMHDGTFWENVKPSRFTDATRPAWMTFDDAWVDEVRRGFAACAVFCWYPAFWLCYNQLNNNLVSQAAVLEKRGLPNDLVQALNPLTLLILIPLMDLFAYPLLARYGVRFTPIKRIASGFYTGAAAMVWAAGLQHYVYALSECGHGASGSRFDAPTGQMVACAPAPISVWMQTPAYVLIALSEVFASITSLEYAYLKAPKSMRSMVQAVALFMTAFAAALGQAFTGLSEDPLLVWNYAIVAIIAAGSGIAFLAQFWELDQAEDELNLLPEGRVRGKEQRGADA